MSRWTRSRWLPVVGVLLVASCATLISLSGCKTIESLGEVGGAVGQATGVMTEEQAKSLGRASKAVAKTFADITPEQEYYIGRAVAARAARRRRWGGQRRRSGGRSTPLRGWHNRIGRPAGLPSR